MSERPVILVFVTGYLPGYKFGGPIRAIENLVHHLGDEFDFRIVTRDRDALDAVPYPNILVDEWNTVNKAKVFYLSPGAFTFEKIAALIKTTRHDVLYLNSLFDFTFSILPLAVCRFWHQETGAIILAPRGELAAGAINLKSGKKFCYLFVAKLGKVFREIIWQASNNYESEDIRRVIGSQADKIFEAIELPPASRLASAEVNPKPFIAGSLKVLFLSRISRSKNLLFALEVLRKVNAEVEFNIVGPVLEPNYWKTCQSAIKSLPGNIHISYLGSIEHSKVLLIFAGNDLFFLPTVGENYGYVVPESLIVGTPVLLSNRGGWRNLVGTGAGWDLPLEEPQKFVEVIQKCAAMSFEQRAELRKNAANYLASNQQQASAIEASRRLFLAAIVESKARR